MCIILILFSSHKQICTQLYKSYVFFFLLFFIIVLILKWNYINKNFPTIWPTVCRFNSFFGFLLFLMVCFTFIILFYNLLDFVVISYVDYFCSSLDAINFPFFKNCWITVLNCHKLHLRINAILDFGIEIFSNTILLHLVENSYKTEQKLFIIDFAGSKFTSKNYTT